MTPNDKRPKVPGQLVLQLVRLVFSDTAVTTLLEPAVADLQRETAAAGGRARVRTQVRGYLGLWTLILMAAFVPSAGAGAPVLATLLGLNGGFLIAFLAPLLFAVLWPAFGVFASGAVVAGLMFSFVVRAWNDRHPVTLARRRGAGKEPEINLSGIPVGGDIGGFFFVVASVVMMFGLPNLRGFVLGATLAALLLAYGLLVWRRGQESPVRRIIAS